MPYWIMAVTPSVYTKYYSIELRDKYGYFKQYLTPFAKDVSWEWNRIGGCGRCRIKLGMEYRKIEFNAGDDIQIRVKSGATSKLVYRGWISNVVPALKVPQDITLDIRGYFDYFDFLVVHDEGDKMVYTNELVSDIVDSIIDTFVTSETNITKGTIDGASFAPDTMQFKSKVSEVLSTLAGLEGEVEYGVDENLVFYWRKQSGTLRHKFIVGNNVEVFERRVDWNKLANKIYFEGGDVAGSPYITIADASDSQEMYFLAEKIVTNSSITTSGVADQFLGAMLKESASPQMLLRIKIPETTLRLEDVIPVGEIAVYDPDYDEGTHIVGELVDGGSDLTVGLLQDGGSNATVGGTYSGQVDNIRYSLSDTDEKFNIEITLGGSILETSAKIKQLELLVSELRQR